MANLADVSAKDCAAMLDLLSRAADPTLELQMPERKRRLAGGLAALVGADVWIWSATAVNHDVPGDSMTTHMIDDGWQSEQERILVYQTLTSSTFTGEKMLPIYNAMRSGDHTTALHTELFTPAEWETMFNHWKVTGFRSFMLSFHPVSLNSSSNVGLHRRADKPDFGIREKNIVHLVLSRIDWMHRHGIHEAAHQQVIRLSPRERQVLMLMLNGQGRKAIAVSLGISEHTVGDYQKKLHKHFNVTSRAELQAYFFLGGQPQSLEGGASAAAAAPPDDGSESEDDAA
jgi:DNA-binding CsgD family transcriptional regulator